MTLSRKQLLIAAGLFLTASSALASAPLQTGFYVGANSGASFVTNQATGHIDLFVDSYNVYDHVHATFKEESSIRGYNGGVFAGWNFYCDESWFHGVELSGDFFSNRGQYAVDLPFVYDVNDSQYSNSDRVDSRAANFKDVYDLEFALNLAFKPGAKINESTVLFGILGASWARFDTEVDRIRHRDPSFEDGASARVAVAHNQYNSNHDNDHEEDLWGFVLGAGVSTQVTHYLSAFASYQYTNYGSVCLDTEKNRESVDGENVISNEGPGRVKVRITDRDSKIDTNVFKVGIAFNF